MPQEDWDTTFTTSKRSKAYTYLHYPADHGPTQAHSRTRVSYFHDESVGNYHYGVSQQDISMFSHIYSFIVDYHDV
jgi:hypothetical protein